MSEQNVTCQSEHAASQKEAVLRSSAARRLIRKAIAASAQMRPIKSQKNEHKNGLLTRSVVSSPLSEQANERVRSVLFKILLSAPTKPDNTQTGPIELH
jgi:hypothetical protein